MAPKVPKKPLQKMEKTEKNIDKPISKTKKTKKRNYANFDIYIYKVLKSLTQAQPMGISKKSLNIMNSFVHDMLERLSMEAGKLVTHSKKHTLGSREVQSAAKLVIPGELAKHALVEGVKALTAYYKTTK